MSRSQNDIFRFPKERVSDGDTFRCRKCRTYLFSFENLTSFHKKVEPVEQCSSWYLTCDDIGGDLSWIRDAVEESEWTEGKIYCTKCRSRIGAFNITQGVRCSCFAYVVPAVWIQKCKVDQVTIADSKPNIRLPRHSGEPGNHHGNNGKQTSQSGQTGSQTGQTGNSCSGTQTSQVCKNGNQTSQTGYNSCGARPNQTSQTGLILDSFDSEPGPSLHTCICTGQTGSKPVYSQIDPQIHSSRHASASQAVLSTVQTGLQHEPEPGPSGLQPEDEHPIQFWPNVAYEHQKMFYPLQYTLEYRIFWERRSLNHDYEMYSDGGSNAYRRHKRTVMNRDDNDSSGEDCDKFNDRSVEEEKNQEKSEESEQIPEHLICPICLDLLYEPLTSPCDHVFCDSCLRLLNSKCRKNVPRCPLCRKSLNYVYPAVDLREEIRKTHPEQYRKRHKTERRAPHRRLPLPSGRLKPRQKNSDHLQDVAMPYSVLVFLVCVLAVCVLCLVILFIFCPPTSNRCVTIIGYD